MDNIKLDFTGKHTKYPDLIVISATKLKKGQKNYLEYSKWPKSYVQSLKKIKILSKFKGELNKHIIFPLPDNKLVLALGLGEAKEVSRERLRRSLSQLIKTLKNDIYCNVCIDAESFDFFKNIEMTTKIIMEAFALTTYSFNKYQNTPKEKNDFQITLFFNKSKNKDAILKAYKKTKIISSQVNFARDLINEVPNVLNSEVMVREVASDVRVNLKASKVKIKVLDKLQIKKEKMNLFLSVNKGSTYEPRLVHLTYRPTKVTKKTKHVALVGKGITFDSGGYSLKPGSSLKGMKFDMAGAATAYSAFKSAVLLKSPHIISCFLGITDNMISPKASVPDSVIKGRSGKSVEIINTDAEGRLVLADLLDYASSFKPQVIIDVATLTGACMRALGHVCGIMGNNDKLINELLEKAQEEDEQSSSLSIVQEYRDDMKSTIADLKNVGSSPNAGAQKAAAFLEKFVAPKIAWAHMDIAGVDTATHLPYCQKGMASGTMIRTITNYLLS